MMSAFISSRTPLWDVNGDLSRRVDLTLFHIKENIVPAADFLSNLARLPGLPAHHVSAVKQLVDCLTDSYGVANQLIYTPHLAGTFYEDKNMEETLEKAKKYTKLLGPGSTAQQFAYTQYHQGLAPARPFSAPPPPPSPSPSSYFSPDPAAPRFPPGSCPAHPTSTTHNAAGCKQLLKRTHGSPAGPGAGGPAGGAGAAPAAGAPRT